MPLPDVLKSRAFSAGARVGGGARLGTLHNCIRTGNSAINGGGSCLATLYNCVYNCALTSNSADLGGGAASGWLYNCTLRSNSTRFGGGITAFWEYGPFDCELHNCLVYFNHAPNGANHPADLWTTFTYSCTTPRPPGLGNIDADPLSVDKAVGNYRLQALIWLQSPGL